MLTRNFPYRTKLTARPENLTYCDQEYVINKVLVESQINNIAILLHPTFRYRQTKLTSSQWHKQ